MRRSASGQVDLLEQIGKRRRWAVELAKLLIDGTVENGSAWLHHTDCFGQSADAL